MKELFLKAKNFFLGFEKNKKILLLSHFDADGISSSAILSSFLKREGYYFDLKIVPFIHKEFLLDYDQIIILDLGSSHLDLLINSYFNKKVLIIDHHELNNFNKILPKNFFLLNPLFFNKNINKEGFCASSLSAFFVNDFFDWALIGVIGDSQEKKGLKGLNKDLLKRSKNISIVKGPKAIGFFEKNILELITSSYDIKPFLKKKKKAINFLKSLNINPNNYFFDLNEDERELLRFAFSELNIDFVDHYFFLNEENQFKEIRFFSTLLNAIGREGEGLLGLEVLNKDINARNYALRLLKNYKKRLWDAKRKVDILLEKDKPINIINLYNNVNPSIIGTIASMIIRSRELNENQIIILSARYDNLLTKISARTLNKNINLNFILNKALKGFDAETGGHKEAAGAIIKVNDENKVFDSIRKTLKKELSLN